MDRDFYRVLYLGGGESVGERLRSQLAESRRARFQVALPDDAGEALSRLSSGEYDVCLFDTRPALEAGLDFLRNVRSLSVPVPVVLIIGDSDDGSARRVLEAGAADFIRSDDLIPRILGRVLRCAAEQARLLRALRESEVEARQLALVAKRTDNAVIITDDRRLTTWVNEGFTRITGFSFADIVGRKPGALLQGPETDPATVRHMHERLESGEGFHVEILNYRKNGGELWFDIEVQPILGEKGGVVGFMAVESDVTERKRTLEALRGSGERLRAIVDNLVDGIITIDHRGVIEGFSPAAERIFGYQSSEICGRSVNLLMPEPYRNEHDGYIARYLETGEPHVIGIGREVVGRRKDGTVFPMDLAVSEIHTDQLRLFVGIVRDISERRHLQGLKDEFLRIASHDLKNPLGSVLGFAGLALELSRPGQPLSERCRGFLERILLNARAMQRIVADFLDFHALEDGKLRIDREDCDLNELARDLVESNREYAERKGIVLKLDLDPGVPTIRVDPSRIRQVVQNLVDNAVKFSPQDSQITVSTRSSDASVEFAVTDAGPGLTEEDFRRVFQKYTRLSSKPTGGEKSSGLGLAICKQLIELHGGEIGVRNNPEKGATFWFRLPFE